jgi:hypothetical protein
MFLDFFNGFFIELSPSLFVLLASETGGRIGHPDTELLCALHDRLPLLGGDTMSDLRAVLPVLHHQDFQLTDIVD